MSKEKKLVPRLRFEKFQGTWKKYKLGEIGSTISGVVFPNSEQGGNTGVMFLKVSDMNLSVNTKEINEANNYVSDAQIKRNRWKVIDDIPAIIFAKVGAALLLDRKRLVSEQFLIDNNMMAYILEENLIPDFTNALFKTIYLPEYSQTGALPSMNDSIVENISIYIPQIGEQQKIGSFFRKIDKMIQLQQSKVNKVKDIKSAYLFEMFPKEGERYPKKRFEGFTKPWQLFKLGELGQFKSNGVNKKIRANDNPAYLLNYMDVYNKLSINQMNYKDLMKVTATSRELQENNIMKNDVFFTPTSETADDIGRVLTLEYDLPETVYSYHLIRFRPFEDKLYSIFPNYGFATKYLRKQMEIAAQGVQRFVISVTAFKDLKVYLPSYEEQIKIANFFKNLDNQISSEEEKLVKLEKLKQAYLNDMFV